MGSNAKLIFGVPALLLLLLLPAGCATRPPLGEPLPERERAALKAIFKAEMEQRRVGLQCLDAEVDLVWRSWLRAGTLPGYLQMRRRPAQLKFVGVDPLGRPLLALLVADDAFRLVLVAEAVAYEGPTSAEAFRRYLPADLASDDLATGLFDWFSGGMPLAGPITGVYRERAGEGFWLQVEEPGPARLLYRPGEDGRLGVVERIVLGEGRGSAAEVVFSDYRRLPVAPEELATDPNSPADFTATEYFELPHQVEILARRQQGLDLTVTFRDLLTRCPTPAHFELSVPRSFRRESVE